MMELDLCLWVQVQFLLERGLGACAESVEMQTIALKV